MAHRHDLPGMAIACPVRIPRHSRSGPCGSSVGAPTILVLDDVQSRREVLCRTLAREGYRTVPARSGIEAQWLHDHQLLRPDLLLTGFAPAELDGYHPGFAVGSMLERVPILFMSELERAESVRRGLIFPWAPYLRYPSPPGVLSRTVRRALTRQDRRPLH